METLQLTPTFWAVIAQSCVIVAYLLRNEHRLTKVETRLDERDKLDITIPTAMERGTK